MQCINFLLITTRPRPSRLVSIRCLLSQGVSLERILKISTATSSKRLLKSPDRIERRKVLQDSLSTQSWLCMHDGNGNCDGIEPENAVSNLSTEYASHWALTTIQRDVLNMIITIICCKASRTDFLSYNNKQTSQQVPSGHDHEYERRSLLFFGSLQTAVRCWAGLRIPNTKI